MRRVNRLIAAGAGAMLAGLAHADAGSGAGTGSRAADGPAMQSGAAPSIWITREQRAQRLLDGGHPAAAARLFSDPRRRAYAQMRAGQDDAAARLLAPLHDADSQYNRGNALARSGRLVPALAAYEAALARAPHDPDIRHNRDLIARMLASSARQSGQSGASRPDASQQRDRKGRNGDAQSASGQSTPDARSAKSSGSRAGESPSTGSATPEQEAEQAREDAALAAGMKRSAGRPRPQSGSGAGGGSQGGGQTDAARTGRAEAGTELPWPPPKSEQALAIEQWLRRIPEDPGGLLRRKFLIEHMERQERSEP